MTDHPITPPPELLHQWATEYWGNPGESIGEGEKYIAIQAARWGADQELEACCEWLSVPCPSYGRELRAARRPKPPSWRAMANNTGATCLRCGKGRYKVFDLNDDIFGDLRCDICRHHVKLNQDLMAEPTPLSPAAQAVLNAYEIASDGHYTDAGEWIQDHAGQIAAALRAAADQVIPEVTLLGSDYEEIALQEARKEILAIAAELEGAE